MGIGLYHSQMIVEAHHGKIEVESEIGRGTTFRVFLPLAGSRG
jgi:signal transduction histidine kinase